MHLLICTTIKYEHFLKVTSASYEYPLACHLSFVTLAMSFSLCEVIKENKFLSYLISGMYGCGIFIDLHNAFDTVFLKYFNSSCLQMMQIYTMKLSHLINSNK